MGFPVFDSLSDNISTQNRIAEKISLLEKAVNKYGLQIKCLTNFQSYIQLVETIPEINGVTKVFDYRFNNINSENGFWIKGDTSTGQIVHLQAFYLTQLQRTSLSQHWREVPELYAPVGYDFDFENCDFDTAKASNEISGKVCYQGDLWLDDSFRDMRLAGLLSRIAFLVALYRFSPDYIYGLMKQKMVEKGWAARAGYLHIHPWAPRWRIKGTSQYYDEHLVWSEGQELETLWTARQRNIDMLGQVHIRKDYRRSVRKVITS